MAESSAALELGGAVEVTAAGVVDSGGSVRGAEPALEQPVSPARQATTTTATSPMPSPWRRSATNTRRKYPSAARSATHLPQACAAPDRDLCVAKRTTRARHARFGSQSSRESRPKWHERVAQPVATSRRWEIEAASTPACGRRDEVSGCPTPPAAPAGSTAASGNCL